MWDTQEIYAKCFGNVDIGKIPFNWRIQGNSPKKRDHDWIGHWRLSWIWGNFQRKKNTQTITQPSSGHLGNKGWSMWVAAFKMTLNDPHLLILHNDVDATPWVCDGPSNLFLINSKWKAMGCYSHSSITDGFHIAVFFLLPPWLANFDGGRCILEKAMCQRTEKLRLF